MWQGVVAPELQSKSVSRRDWTSHVAWVAPMAGTRLGPAGSGCLHGATPERVANGVLARCAAPPSMTGASMTGAVASLLTVALLVGGALVIGATPARQVDGDLLRVERLATAFLLGAGILGLAVFAVGLVKLDRLTITVIVAVSYSPLLSRRVRSWLRDTLASVWSRFSAAHIGHLAVLGVLLLAAVPRPTGDMGNDTISYHLLGPAVWLRTGRIVPVLDSSHTAFPALMESLFSAGIGLSNDRFPAMLGVAFAAVLLAQVYGFSRVLGASNGKATLMGFFAACAPAIMSSAPSGFVDIGYASFSLAAVRLLLLGELSTSRATIGGVLLGFALGIKYTAIPLAAVTLLVLLVAYARRLAPLALFCRAALVMGVSALVGSPFYLKNIIALGSPIYPPPVFLTHWFHARAFPVEASYAFDRYVAERGRGLGRGPLDLLLLPWRYTLFTDKFHGAGGVGAAPLALGVIGALTRRGWHLRGVLMLWMGLVTLCWFLTQQESRFLIHVVVMSFAFAAVGALWIEQEWPRAGRGSILVAAVVSTGYGMAVMVRQQHDRLAAALSSGAEHRLRQRDVPYLEAWDYLNHEPSVRCVLILNELVPPYYLTKDYVKIRGLYGERPIRGIETAPEAIARISDLGVTHVLDVAAPRWSLRNDIPAGAAPDVRVAFDSDRARVYEVVPGPGGRGRNGMSGQPTGSGCDKRAWGRGVGTSRGGAARPLTR
jgi:hypothetical protein